MDALSSNQTKGPSSPSNKRAEYMSSLETFQSSLASAIGSSGIAEGEEIYFGYMGKSEFLIAVRNKLVGNISDAVALRQNLLQIYLSKSDSVVPSLVRDLEART
jgi:hypothetical protein